ncbi:MAG: DUF167 domain-containing protein [Candidatus Omnitrophica bacterium]|nr:DUF167 domain-containing protein [Candidatus Omnitrophota bacterium]
MRIEVRVTPKASRDLIKKETEILKVYLTKPACEGLANARLIELLSDYLKVKKYQIKIIRGHKTRSKLIEVNV